jgi:hypothetical protein
LPQKIFFQTHASAALSSRARVYDALRFLLLKDQFQRELNFARIAKLQSFAKVGAVRDISVHTVELGVIKQVVKLCSEFHS